MDRKSSRVEDVVGHRFPLDFTTRYRGLLPVATVTDDGTGIDDLAGIIYEGEAIDCTPKKPTKETKELVFFLPTKISEHGGNI
jgi:hypothetical protein